MEIDKKQLKEVLEYTSYKIYCDIQNINNEIKEENKMLGHIVDDDTFQNYLENMKERLLELEKLKKYTHNMLYQFYK